jgi:hypothetical protein
MPSNEVIVLHDDAFEELRSAATMANQLISFSNNGELDDDSFSIGGVIYRRYKYIPTEEDIARRAEFQASPLGQLMQGMWKRCEVKLARRLLETDDPLLEVFDSDNWQWPDTMFPRTLKVRSPGEY